MTTPKPLSESSEEPLPQTAFHGQRGNQIGQYQLLDVIGSGGMGVVYRALHTRLRQVVALKTLSAPAALDPRAIGRFDREIEAQGALVHPNIVRATDAGDWQGIHYLVMEYVDGIDLKKAVQGLGPLDIADACEAVRQAALGLQYIHENKRVHRDLKPSNLMVTREGQVKILDLGLALLFGEAEGKEEITGSQQAMGTADYMAPEQWLDSHLVDIRADLYSLGCTLYKLLTGIEPFATLVDKNRDKRQAHLTMPVPDIRGLRPDVPDGLLPILDRILAKAPEHRYARPVELAEALLPFCEGSNLAKLTAVTAAVKAREDTETKKTLTYEMPAGPAADSDAGPTNDRRRWVRVGLGMWVLVVAVVLVVLFWKRESDLPWPADFPESMKTRRPGEPIALVAFREARPDNPQDKIRGKVSPTPKGKTYQPLWYRRLAGTGRFYELNRGLRLDSSATGGLDPTVLALDDDLHRNWFELEAVLHPLSKNQKNYCGLFFGWNASGAKSQAYFLGLENGKEGLQLTVAQLTLALDNPDSLRIAPLPAPTATNGCRALLPKADRYRVLVRALPKEILITVNGKEIGRLNPSPDPCGPCGIWVQEGSGSFERILVTALPREF